LPPVRQSNPRDLEVAPARLAPIMDAVGAASSRDWICGTEVCSAKASRRGVIAALIVKTDARPLGGDVVESPASLALPKET
jgi:hypothetical protein